ncbi:CHAT domain-containing protein [Azospirillum thermophilum]|nr:CHAT domain-containing protein [Azospirillum thermophilum]
MDARTLNDYARAVWLSASEVTHKRDQTGAIEPKTLENLRNKNQKNKCSFGPNDQRDGYLCAAGLYETIFRHTVGTPVRGGASGTLSGLLNDTRLLSIVAGGDLGRIPFSILPTDRKALEALIDGTEAAAAEKWPWLIWKHATAYAPTAAAYVHSRNMVYTPSRSYSIFSDPLKPSTPREAGIAFESSRCELDYEKILMLKSTEAEEIAPLIARYFPQSSNNGICNLKSGRMNRCEQGDNTIKNLQDVAATNSGGYIHLYTHGFGPGKLTCAREASILMSPSKDSDGRYQLLLKESRIMGMSFKGAMIVSQACDVVQGDEYWVGPNGWDGLARAFLFAGARGFIGSYWQSDYDSSNEIMLRLFERIGRDGMEPWQALWEAQKSIIRAPKSRYDWSHPYYWGNFAIGGNPI